MIPVNEQISYGYVLSTVVPYIARQVYSIDSNLKPLLLSFCLPEAEGSSNGALQAFTLKTISTSLSLSAMRRFIPLPHSLSHLFPPVLLGSYFSLLKTVFDLSQDPQFSHVEMFCLSIHPELDLITTTSPLRNGCRRLIGQHSDARSTGHRKDVISLWRA